MANKEDYLDALTAYSKSPSRDIPAILEQYLSGVAKNGETLFHWQLLKPLIMGKMDQVIGELRQRLSSEHIPDRPNVENVGFDAMHDRIMDALSKFNGAPFTIQRLCELLIDPKRHYRRSDKFLRGLEKNVSIVSTVDPYGRKVVSESGIKHLVNGTDTNGSPFFPRDSNITSNLPPVPGWVTTSSSSSRPKRTPATDASEQKPSEQTSPAASLPTSACDSDNALSSPEADQKEAVVHSDIVEETVVTMDTSETGTVATDGGEAMAEMDDSEEDMQGVDSSASSSSSFPEELSVSTTGESSAAQVETNSSVTSTQARTETSETSEAESETNSSVTSTQARTETSEAESDMDTSSDCNLHSSDSPSSSHNLHPSPDKQTELTSSSEASSRPVECSEQNDLIDTIAESDSESTSCSSQEQESSSDSCSSSAPAPGENAASPSGTQRRGSDIGDSCSTTASDVESDRSRIDIDDVPSSTASSSSDDHLNHEPSSSNTAEVTASSTTDLLPSVTPLVCAETRDSVAGLERLVDSVDTSVLPAPFSSVPTLPPLTCRQENSESSGLSSSFDTSLDCEEPEAKHRRLSDKETSSSFSTLSSAQVSASSETEAASSETEAASSETEAASSETEAASSETEAASSETEAASSVTEASSSNCTSDTAVKSDILADSSDSTVGTPHATSEDLKAEQESPTAALCSADDMDGSSVVSSENGTSSHQISSPGDSQGFDVIENTVRNNSAEEK